jgi:hypothetical protein
MARTERKAQGRALKNCLVGNFSASPSATEGRSQVVAVDTERKARIATEWSTKHGLQIRASYHELGEAKSAPAVKRANFRELDEVNRPKGAQRS